MNRPYQTHERLPDDLDRLYVQLGGRLTGELTSELYAHLNSTSDDPPPPIP